MGETLWHLQEQMTVHLPMLQSDGIFPQENNHA